MKKVIIIGAGGHAKVIADIVIKCGDELVGFLDDNTVLPDKIVGYPYLGIISSYHNYADECFFIIGIGNNHIRKKIADSLNVKWYTAIHPSSQIAIDTIIGEGTAVMANAVVNTSAHIGKHCIINTGAVIEHDNVMSDYVHVSPNSALCGTVSVGAFTHVGAGAVIKNNISVCDNVVIGAGATVVKNIKEKGIYIGIPVRKLKDENFNIS